MILNIREVLEKTNYFIKYDFVDNKAQIEVSFANKKHTIYYDPKTYTMYSTLEDMQIQCDVYVAPTLSMILLNHLCDYYEYPIEFVCYYLDGNKCANFNFGFSDGTKEASKAQLLLELYYEIMKTGVMPEHIEIAKENEIFDGMKLILELYLGISVHDD